MNFKWLFFSVLLYFCLNFEDCMAPQAIKNLKLVASKPEKISAAAYEDYFFIQKLLQFLTTKFDFRTHGIILTLQLLESPSTKTLKLLLSLEKVFDQQHQLSQDLILKPNQQHELLQDQNLGGFEVLEDDSSSENSDFLEVASNQIIDATDEIATNPDEWALVPYVPLTVATYDSRSLEAINQLFSQITSTRLELMPNGEIALFDTSDLILAHTETLKIFQNSSIKFLQLTPHGLAQLKKISLQVVNTTLRGLKTSLEIGLFVSRIALLATRFGVSYISHLVNKGLITADAALSGLDLALKTFN